MLSRKYYKEIAEILNALKFDVLHNGLKDENILNRIENDLIAFFKSDNRRFNESRFLTAVNNS